MSNTAEHTKPAAAFEPAYLSLRQKEGRLYTDAQVLSLPVLPAKHPLANEWKQRAASARRLVHYLRQQRRPLKILEIGCGNGWLAHKLSLLPGTEVKATDINTTELMQAQRLFKASNLEFIRGDVQDLSFPHPFDCIVFAASFQYFPSAITVLDRCLQILDPDGEIHIIDTPFYTGDEAAFARKRSQSYFGQMNASSMNDFYFHHTEESLGRYRWRCLHRASPLAQRWLHANPFPWFLIQH